MLDDIENMLSALKKYQSAYDTPTLKRYSDVSRRSLKLLRSTIRARGQHSFPAIRLHSRAKEDWRNLLYLLKKAEKFKTHEALNRLNFR